MLTRDFEVNGGKVSVLQKLELGHAGTVWDGALVLLAYLNKHRLMSQEMLQGKVVLELGSGTGIVGLACNLFQAKTVILTDFPENLQLLRDNTQLNFPKADNVLTQDLSWGDQKSLGNISSKHTVDIVIGSELAYDADNTRLLLQTIDYFKQRNPKLMTLISYSRYPQPHKNLLTYLKGRKFHEINESEMDDCYRDDSIGIIVMD